MNRRTVLCLSHSWLFHPFAGLPPGLFAPCLIPPWLFRPLACSPPYAWLIRPLAPSSPGLFALWLIAPCAWLIRPWLFRLLTLDVWRTSQGANKPGGEPAKERKSHNSLLASAVNFKFVQEHDTRNIKFLTFFNITNNASGCNSNGI